LAGCKTSGVGFTVIIKPCAIPGQLFADGITLIVAVIGALVKLIAVNDGIFPTPFAARPIAVLLLFQAKPVPLTAPVKFIALVVAALHKTWLAGMATLGVGFIVIIKFWATPGHPFATGVTVIVAATGALVKFIAVNEGIFPLPLAAKPMLVLLFVHVKPVPLTDPVKFTAFVATALHKV
jgi:hypothetical protein